MSEAEELVKRLNDTSVEDRTIIRDAFLMQEAAEMMDRMAAALESLTYAAEMQHGSMCPANRCTCDLNETLYLQARSARQALSTRTGG